MAHWILHRLADDRGIHAGYGYVREVVEVCSDEHMPRPCLHERIKKLHGASGQKNRVCWASCIACIAAASPSVQHTWIPEVLSLEQCPRTQVGNQLGCWTRHHRDGISKPQLGPCRGIACVVPTFAHDPLQKLHPEGALGGVYQRLQHVKAPRD